MENEKAKVSYNWEDIVGQRELVENLQSAITYEKTSHAYMIQGEKLSGKKMIADVFARALQCEDPVNRPCNKCKSCLQAMSGIDPDNNNPDIKYIHHERPNTIRVDEIREQLINDIIIKPYSYRYKIYIIDEAQKLNIQAQNALLKTLEEPPGYGVIILLTTNAEAMLPTILSRCVNLEIKPVSENSIINHLMEKKKIPDYRARICANFARGNMGRAIILASNDDFENLKAATTDILKNIFDVEIATMAEFARKVNDTSQWETTDVLDLCQTWYRDILVYKSCGKGYNLVFSDNSVDIERLAGKYTFGELNIISEEIEHARRRIAANVNMEYVFELMFMCMQCKK